jgi:amphi-Trp domain-containing protein
VTAHDEALLDDSPLDAEEHDDRDVDDVGVDDGDEDEDEDEDVAGRATLELALEEEILKSDAAARLRALADALESGAPVRVEGWDGELVLRVPELVLYELQVEVGASSAEIEVELSWTPASGEDDGA